MESYYMGIDVSKGYADYMGKMNDDVRREFWAPSVLKLTFMA